MRCRNEGAPHHREDGEVIDAGEEFDATADELTRYAYKLKVVEEPPPLWADTQEVQIESQEWVLQMQPELYLRVYPQGAHAALARRIVERGESNGESNYGDSSS